MLYLTVSILQTSSPVYEFIKYFREITKTAYYVSIGITLSVNMTGYMPIHNFVDELGVRIPCPELIFLTCDYSEQAHSLDRVTIYIACKVGMGNTPTISRNRCINLF